MGEFEEIVQKIRAKGISGAEAADALAKFSSSALMKRAQAADQLRKEIAEAKAEQVALQARAKAGELRGTLQRAGVDVQRVRPAEWQALAERLPESGEADEAWIADAVSELGLPVRPSGR